MLNDKGAPGDRLVPTVYIPGPGTWDPGGYRRDKNGCVRKGGGSVLIESCLLRKGSQVMLLQGQHALVLIRQFVPHHAEYFIHSKRFV
jgi:hypothetical protein